MKYILPFIVLWLSPTSQSQTLKGTVLDSLSKKPLSYANFVIKGKNIGAYSDELGNYSISIIKVSRKDTLVVSLIGYHPQKISLADFIGSKNLNYNFELSPKTEQLEEVFILNKAKTYYNHSIKLTTGNRNQVFPATIPFGYETATLIENPKQKKGKLIALHIKFKDSSREIYETHQTYYRLAFYTINDLGFPGQLLYYESIIIKPEIDKKNYKFDLEDKAIPFTEKGIFVSLETVKPDNVKLKSSMYLTTPSLLHTHTKKALKYTRFGSNDWSLKSRKSVFKKKLFAVPFLKLNIVYEKD